MKKFIATHFPMIAEGNTNLIDIQDADSNEYRNLLIVGYVAIGCTAIVGWKAATKVVGMLKDAHS